MLNFQRSKTIPGLTTALEDAKGILWWGIRELVTTLPGILVSTARWNNASSDQDVLPQGLLLGKIRASGKLKEWEPAATNGSEDIFGILMHEQNMLDITESTGSGDRMVSVIVGGPVKPSGFYIDGTLAAGINAHAQELLIRAQLQNRCIFDDEPQMSQFGGWRNTKPKTAAYTLVEADNNTLFTNLGATADVVLTLPAPREGYRVGVFVAVDEKLAIQSASGAPIIADGDVTRSTIDLPPDIGTMVEIIGIGVTGAEKYIATIIPGSPRTSTAGNRYRLEWTAGQRGKPGLNENILNTTESVRMIADPDFEVLGTNMTAALSTFDVEGGITLTTAGADADQAILSPHVDANQSAWNLVTWGTDQELEWECRIKTGASIDTQIILAGFKTTVVGATGAVNTTDNDEWYFRYEDDVTSGNWESVWRVNGGSVTAEDSGIAVAVNTEYHLKISIDSDRIARFYINGVLVETSTALKDATNLKPYIFVEDDGTGSARDITVRGQTISRNAA